MKIDETTNISVAAGQSGVAYDRIRNAMLGWVLPEADYQALARAGWRLTYDRSEAEGTLERIEAPS